MDWILQANKKMKQKTSSGFKMNPVRDLPPTSIFRQFLCGYV